nr:hypothetical protein [Tanacetum cinerariifolium]
MLEAKFKDLCEEVSNFVKEIKDMVKEVERLSCKDVANETVRLFRRGQKHELAVAANSRGLFEWMLVYCDRENARDLEFANGLDNLSVELLERTNERKLFITKLEGLCPSAKREINLDLQFAVGLSQLWDVLYNRVNEMRMLSSDRAESVGGPLAVQCAEYLKQLSKTEVLKMLKLRKTIAKLAITLKQVTKIHLDWDQQVVPEPVENSEVLPPKTAEEILARERERKEKTTLLMAIPEDHLAEFHKMTDAKEMFQSLLSQLKTHGAGVSTEDANQKFLRSLPSFWSQVSFIMRTKPREYTLSFDDLYNNLRVFEYDVKGSTGSSSSTQNVAFVSSDNISSTDEVNTAYGVSTSSGHNSQKEGSSSYTDDLMYSFFASQSSGQQLDHEDLEQVDEFDLEEMDLKWQVAMISTRLKKFYKKTGRKLHFNAKEPVGFNKSKLEYINCHNTRHFARESRSIGNLDSVDWTGHAKDDPYDYALMAFNFSNSGSDTEMSAKDKSGLGYGSQIHDGVLSYESEVFENVFDSRSSDVEDSHVNDRFAKVEEMHAVPPPMTRNYMPPKTDFGIDESKFTCAPKKSTTSESDAKSSDLDSCQTSSSEEPLETVPKPVDSKPKVVNEPKVWFDAPIIEEYESDSDDEYVSKASVEQEKPSCAFINTVKHVETPRQTIQD